MPSSTTAIILGLDVHKNTISAAILRAGQDVADVERISSDDDAVRRLVARLGNPRRLRACYEAGPTGYELCRLLRRVGVACEVIAPSLIPTAPGDRVKTDKRDCRRLARMYRAQELVAIRVPTVAEEAVRDLCRARDDMVIDRTRVVSPTPATSIYAPSWWSPPGPTGPGRPGDRTSPPPPRRRTRHRGSGLGRPGPSVWTIPAPR
jgi:hypothetical protein